MNRYPRAHVSGFAASVSPHIWLRFQPIYHLNHDQESGSDLFQIEAFNP